MHVDAHDYHVFSLELRMLKDMLATCLYNVSLILLTQVGSIYLHWKFPFYYQ